MRHLLLVTILFCQTLSSQSNFEKKLDSMSTLAAKSGDSLKYDIYNQMAFYYVFRDSIKADSILRKNIKSSSSKISNAYSNSLLNNTLGILKAVHGDLDSAYIYYDKSLAISASNDFKDLQARAYNNKGLGYWNKGLLSRAQEYFFKSLKISENYLPKDPKHIYYNNIGLIYQELEEIDKALVYHLKALDDRKKRKLIPEQIASYNNLGICYKMKNQLDKALKNYNKAISLSDSTNTYINYQSINNNLGNIFVETKNYNKAIAVFNKAIQKPSNGTLDKIAQHQGYGNLSYAYLLTAQKAKARQFSEKALTNLQENPNFLSSSETVLHAASLLKAISGDLETSKTLYDSLETIRVNKFSKQNATAIAEYETKYKTVQKEAALAQARANLSKQELEVRKKKQSRLWPSRFSFFSNTIRLPFLQPATS